MATEKIEKGDQVSWKWSGSRPSGEAVEVKEQGDVSVTSNRGNTITRHGKEGDPAVHIARSGNDVVKNAHELSIEKKGNGSDKKAEKGKEEPISDEQEEEKEVNETDAKTNGATTGDKHARDAKSTKNSKSKKDTDTDMKDESEEEEEEVDEDEEVDEEEDDEGDEEEKADEPAKKKQKTAGREAETIEVNVSKAKSETKRKPGLGVTITERTPHGPSFQPVEDGNGKPAEKKDKEKRKKKEEK